MIVGGLVVLGAVVWWLLDSNLERRSIQALEEQGDVAPASPAATSSEGNGTRPTPVSPSPRTGTTSPEPAIGDVTEFLVVGSDDRGDLSEEQRRELSTGGDFGPPRTDVILLVQLRPEDERAAVVSFPRDLLVTIDGSQMKINELMAEGGPNLLVRTVENLSDLELDHYLEVSIPTFLTVVDAVGGAEVCLDEPLVDEKAGADLPAGCQVLDGPDALSFVRSREGDRGDFARIARQQRFLAALAAKLRSARTLFDIPRLLRVVNRVSGSITTDQDLTVGQLRQLANELGELAQGGLTEVTVPAYAADNGLRVYEPGAEAMFAALRRGERIPPRGPRDARTEAEVVLYSAGVFPQAARIESTLYFLGYAPRVAGVGPLRPDRTTVYAGPDDAEVAEWVGHLLGAPIEPLPDGVAVRDGVDAVVAVGPDDPA